MSEVRFLPVGPDALLVEVADTEMAQATYRLVRQLSADPFLAAPTDVVPGARTVLLSGVSDVSGWRAALRAHVCEAVPTGTEGVEAREVVVAAHYDGPDLGIVATAWGCDAGEVVRRHLAARFTVAFCGFAPGFAYCTSDLTARYPLPRRAEPRPRVPAGSVALAGEYCGIYPREMPGGWQLVATTDEVLFDPDRSEPALLRPGDRVRFEAVR
jgi:KipI family sensor histidine kinase inhibitor